MRRLVIEIDEKEFEKYEENSPLNQIKNYEIIHLLRVDREEFAAIIKIEFKDPSYTIYNLLDRGNLEKIRIQLLERDKSGVGTYFVSGKPEREDVGDELMLSFGGYLSAPFEIRGGRIKVGFLGDNQQIKTLLGEIEKIGVSFKVVSLTDAKFSPESPLNLLTEKQREVIVSAFEHGYYETPRRISSQELAKKLKMKSSTLVEHRRKAEQRLLSKIIKEN